MSGYMVVFTAAFLLTVCSCGQALEVTIRYSAPALGFTLPIQNRQVAAVAFHYVIKHVEYVRRGVQTSEGWQYITRDVSLDGADSVVAYAVIYDVNGNRRMTTGRSTLSLESNNILSNLVESCRIVSRRVVSVDTRPIARLPNRRIRGAVVFRDDFNSFNRGNWNYEVSMFGGYTLTVDDSRFDENFLHNGKMDMTQLFGYCTESGNYGCVREGKYGMLPPIMSGKLKSVPTLRYGIVEVRARIPQGDWLWPGEYSSPSKDTTGRLVVAG
ncbi:beta-1,3-glucan-binding protein [Plakobranchus ocellatus]|uniref:Beta-1,3-glucan-binding protein n=1 Tax=Plakobranchus ocellatus TaxID=259542 RepID=A0AAV3XW41_9GAST|nr:beta-1,3-glucan-binding protein [Plakobranchus ocellatus]